MTDVSSADVPSEVPEPDSQAVSVDSAEAPEAEAVDVPVEAPSDGVSESPEDSQTPEPQAVAEAESVSDPEESPEAPVVELARPEVPLHEVDQDGDVVTPTVVEAHPAPDPAVVDSSNTTHVVDAEGNLVLRNAQEV